VMPVREIEVGDRIRFKKRRVGEKTGEVFDMIYFAGAWEFAVRTEDGKTYWVGEDELVF